MDKKLVAPCGMNCSICIAYFGYTMKGIKRKTICQGCIPSGKSCTHLKKHCEKLTKNEVEYCYECSDFPCTQLKRLDRRYREQFNMSMVENLEYIRDKGIDSFLEQQENKYKCPECNGVICVHNNICYNCETDE
ncbi:MAG: DUF3795 domain-containing protein [Candidatus Thermoplasmatota archaeon]